MVLQNDIDLLNPPAELEKRKHKLKRLVPSPNSYFMHNYFQSLTDSRGMRKVSERSVPTYRRQGQAHSRMLFQEAYRLNQISS
ncbi:Zinc-binding ribosomal protein family protein [Arabidopsis thaliana]|uniref:Uncharacterized protein n=2 Tax=Arabidopsis thaliana TaxID=3702 RepID=A0A384KT73_ARATH|nr:Zinc-binding ribosomal protein family protein [Arabidopsis thaliana]ANM64646.1 Zinc-binding ribosomal protein family protein [Arabidopsis thaliana]OAP06920.1 hypothetical protein AXX17_AT3G55370 [Arabidopsis thaliana]|eukprot:NP_001326659.1 Zinc-binding ribosomal protein family protein [Arabidopsis thaliana]